MFKSVTITIPNDAKLPEKFLEFTPEKVLLAIKVGYKCVLDAEQSMLGLTEENIYNKVKDETKDELKRLEMDLLIEKEMKDLITILFKEDCLPGNMLIEIIDHIGDINNISN